MEQLSIPSFTVAPRRSLDCLGMDLSCDNDADADTNSSSPLNPGHHGFFFSAPTSPRVWQTLDWNNKLDLYSVPDSRLGLDDDNKQQKQQHERVNYGNENGNDCSGSPSNTEFEFSAAFCKSADPPLTPTLTFISDASSSSSSSGLIFFPPVVRSPPPILKPLPPFLQPTVRKAPHRISVKHTQEDPLAFENFIDRSEGDGEGEAKAIVKAEAEAKAKAVRGKPLKVKKWRLKDWLWRRPASNPFKF